MRSRPAARNAAAEDVRLADLVRRRRMVRRYRPQVVDPVALERVLDLARRAPTAGHSQGQDFVVVRDPVTRRRIAALCREPAYVARGFEPWLSSAPVHVVPCVDPRAYRRRYTALDKAGSRGPDAWRVPFWHVDGGAALMLLLLAVVEEGLAAGFLDVAEPEALRALLGIPDEVLPLGLVTIGHPAQDRRSGSLMRGRRPLHEVVHEERW
jgi:nitroreductase